MSYLGQVELKSSEIRRVDVTSSTSATHTLTWTPASEQSLIITINGIKQQNNYSISGVTLTLDDALLSADKMEVIGILDIGEAVVPPDDSITTAKIQDDAVTAAKLANSINTEITANTAKVTNATHTGDVTGATALTIATDAVDIAMLSATGTASSSTFLRGDNAWASAGGDNTPSFSARNSAAQTGMTSDTYYKIAYNTEFWDADSVYDHTTNYRFTVPAGEGGKYSLSAIADLRSSAANGGVMSSTIAFYLNGAQSDYYRTYNDWRGSSGGGINRICEQVNVVMSLSAADYIEVFARVEVTGGGTWSTDNNIGFFTGYKLIGI
jgi:hypothetical protein